MLFSARTTHRTAPLRKPCIKYRGRCEAALAKPMRENRSSFPVQLSRVAARLTVVHPKMSGWVRRRSRA